MEENLNNDKQDHLVAGLKSITGALPVIGPFLQELVTYIIPNQRIDRIVKFLRILESKLEANSIQLTQALMSNENIAILTEDAFRDAAQATTNERREYIASLLTTGIKQDKVSSVETRYLFKILNSINDIEIIILLFYSKHLNEGQELRNKNEHIFENRILLAGALQTERDKHALYVSYLEHLSNLGLLQKAFKWEKKGFADETRRFEKPESNFSITDFGKLLLRSIDLHHT